MKIINFGPGPLYKFCPAEYDITNGCNTIRFGTLYDYRTIEDELLRDEGEGKFSYKLAFPELTKVSNEWISSIEMDGSGNISIDQLAMTNDGTYIKGVDLTGSSHNCWIFCVSRSAESAGNISEAHQHKWAIPGENIAEFAANLSILIRSEIKYSDLPPELVNNHSIATIQQGIGIQTEFREVIYGNRELHIASETELPIKDMEKIRAEIPFTKPEKFKLENEFRFAFFLTFHGKKISINNNSKILSLRPIDRILKPLNV